MAITEVTKGGESRKRIDIPVEASTSNGDVLIHLHILGRHRPFDEGQILHITPEDAHRPLTDTPGDRLHLERDHVPHTLKRDRRGVRSHPVFEDACPLRIDGGQGLPERKVTAMV